MLGVHAGPSRIYRHKKCTEPLQIVYAKLCQRNAVDEKPFSVIHELVQLIELFSFF